MIKRLFGCCASLGFNSVLVLVWRYIRSTCLRSCLEYRTAWSCGSRWQLTRVGGARKDTTGGHGTKPWMLRIRPSLWHSTKAARQWGRKFVSARWKVNECCVRAMGPRAFTCDFTLSSCSASPVSGRFRLIIGGNGGSRHTRELARSNESRVSGVRKKGSWSSSSARRHLELTRRPEPCHSAGHREEGNTSVGAFARGWKS